MRDDDGYTVLEGLVAFAILSVVLVALYDVAATSLRGIDKDSQIQRVTLLAQSKLDEIAADRFVLPAAAHGDFAQGDVGWSLTTADIPSARAEATSAKLQDVQLTLTWADGLRTRSQAFQTRHLGIVRQ